MIVRDVESDDGGWMLVSQGQHDVVMGRDPLQGRHPDMDKWCCFSAGKADAKTWHLA